MDIILLFLGIWCFMAFLEGNIITALILAFTISYLYEPSNKIDVAQEAANIVEHIKKYEPITKFEKWSFKYSDYNNDNDVTNDEQLRFKEFFMIQNNYSDRKDGKFYNYDGSKVSKNELMTSMDYYDRMYGK